MSWKYVFNSNHKFLAGNHINDVLNFVLTTGYNFFTFNGHVYDLRGGDTGLTTEDLF